jgi:glycosyltransferase involved in cell wall biosynthesis
MPDRESVSVIMPTEAHRDRAESLRRALQSVLSQTGVRPLPIVVVNGPRGDPTLVAELERRPGVRVVRLAEAGLPAALVAGRALVDAPYFAELDDDDELLDGSLATRADALRAHPDVDVAVTSGFVESGGRREVNIVDFDGYHRDPLRALLRRNWLVPCAGLFRAATITGEFFGDIAPYLEWTYLQVRLALERRMLFIDRPTWVYRTDTPRSLSKSRQYVLQQPASLRRVLALALPADVRRQFEGRLCAALHAAAALELDAGNHAAAWRWHLRSLGPRGGLRHALYTRRLLYALCRPARVRRGPGAS